MSDTDLGDVARQGLDDVPESEGGLTAAQGTFEGTDYTKVKFVGVQYDTLEMATKIGDEVAFTVRGRIVAVGDEAMKDAHIRHVAKVEVHSVEPLADGA